MNASGFIALLAVAFMMGANHVAARLAFNSGLSVPTAVAVRSMATVLVILAVIVLQRVPAKLTQKQRRGLLAVGLLIAMQSLCLYSAVARIPVALALLTFNTFPLWAAFWEWTIYKKRPDQSLLWALPLIFLGLVLALDVPGAVLQFNLRDWLQHLSVGLLFASVAALFFGLALVLTQYETAGVDGRVRTASTLFITGSVALMVLFVLGGASWPRATMGWWALAALALFYGSAFTLLFTVLPRMGVGKNAALMNVEPVFALLLAWVFLGQGVNAVQLCGATLVVAVVVGLGLRR